MAPSSDGDSQAAWIEEVRAAIERRLADPEREPPEHDVEALVDLIDRGREQLDNPQALTRATAEGMGGAVYGRIAISFTRGGEADLPDLLPQLMFFVTRPYVGVDAALTEFHRQPLERLAEGRGDA